MEQIVTLGIGGTPASLTPFITTGLEIGEFVFIVAPVCESLSDAKLNVITLFDMLDTLPNYVSLLDTPLCFISLLDTPLNVVSLSDVEC
jgi:hypothetical protein